MDKPVKLTANQQRLCDLIKKGMTNIEIMKCCGCTRNAVQNMLRTVRLKYGITNRERLVVFLLQEEFEKRVDKIREIVYGKET